MLFLICGQNTCVSSAKSVAYLLHKGYAIVWKTNGNDVHVLDEETLEALDSGDETLCIKDGERALVLSEVSALLRKRARTDDDEESSTAAKAVKQPEVEAPTQAKGSDAGATHGVEPPQQRPRIREMKWLLRDRKVPEHLIPLEMDDLWEMYKQHVQERDEEEEVCELSDGEDELIHSHSEDEEDDSDGEESDGGESDGADSVQDGLIANRAANRASIETNINVEGYKYFDARKKKGYWARTDAAKGVSCEKLHSMEESVDSMAERLKKIDALRNDPNAPPSEREQADQIFEKLKKKVSAETMKAFETCTKDSRHGIVNVLILFDDKPALVLKGWMSTLVRAICTQYNVAYYESRLSGRKPACGGARNALLHRMFVFYGAKDLATEAALTFVALFNQCICDATGLRDSWRQGFADTMLHVQEEVKRYHEGCRNMCSALQLSEELQKRALEENHVKLKNNKGRRGASRHNASYRAGSERAKSVHCTKSTLAQ